MANYQSTQKLRGLFESDEEKKKKEGQVTVSSPAASVDYSRADNSASALKDAFKDFGQSAPSRQPKPEQAAPVVEEVKPRQTGEYRGNFFQKLGQSYFDVIKSVPVQTARGVGMIFNAPNKVAEVGSDLLMKNDSYRQYMEDAARGIDLGKGRAAIGVLNTGALGIGDLKPILNTKVGQEIVTNVADKTSNLPIKAVAGLRAIGEGTYKEYRDAMIADRNNPENGNVKKFLYELQDSGVQSLVGILLTTGTVLATRNPKAGYAIGGAYYGSLSAAEQIQSEGEVKSSGNIYIDVIGDSLINNALLGVFKMPAKAITRVLATGGLEGSTEVVQSLLKFSNSYTQAKTDAERQDIMEDAVNYVKSGAILMEFGVGAVVGGSAQATVEVSNSVATSKTRTDVKNSFAFDIEAAIKAGDVDPATIYQNGQDGALTAKFAEGRINDVAQKLGKLDPTLETQYRDSVDVNNATMEGIISTGETILDTFTSPAAAGAEEVLNTAGSKKTKEATGGKIEGDVYKDIETIADLIARADSGQELSTSEQTALVQARQSFIDYSNAFQATTVSIPNQIAPTEPPIAQIQVVDVGSKVAVKYSADAGETALIIDYDLNTLYSSPEAATKAAIDSIAAFIESQKSNPNISPVAQSRFEDIMQQLRPPKKQAAIKVPTKPADVAAPVETAPTAGGFALGTQVNFAGRSRKVTAVIPFGGETKYQLTDEKGSYIYTNEAGMKTAVEATELGITEEEVLKRRNEANGTPKKSQKDKVKEVIDEKGEASIKDIADITGILEPNIRRILGTGAKSGEFERVDAGVYRLKVDGKDVAFVMAADAVETLPKLAAQGFKADMVFLDIPYETKAVKGGNRGVNYDFLSVDDFKKVVTAIKTIARDENTPVIHMYSQAESGMKEMTAYNEVFPELGFKPVAKGEWQKTYKDGSPVAFPTRNGSMVTKPEGILVFTLSGETDKQLESLQFKTVRPKGYQTEKAEEMLKAMIEMTTEEGDVVFDPFAGSGSTGAAAVKAGRKTVAIEKNADVVENITKPRIENAVNGASQAKTKLKTGDKFYDVAGRENTFEGDYKEGTDQVLISDEDNKRVGTFQIITKEELNGILARQDEFKEKYESNLEFQKSQDAIRQSEQEKIAAAKSVKEANVSQYSIFLEGKNEMQKGQILATLTKKEAYNGKTMERGEAMREFVKEGAEIQIVQEDKIKPMSRRKFNQSSNAEQEAHERRVKEGGKKSVYLVNNFEVTKTEYDYAQFLLETDTKTEVSTPSKTEANQPTEQEAYEGQTDAAVQKIKQEFEDAVQSGEIPAQLYNYHSVLQTPWAIFSEDTKETARLHNDILGYYISGIGSREENIASILDLTRKRKAILDKQNKTTNTLTTPEGVVLNPGDEIKATFPNGKTIVGIITAVKESVTNKAGQTAPAGYNADFNDPPIFGTLIDPAKVKTEQYKLTPEERAQVEAEKAEVQSAKDNMLARMKEAGEPAAPIDQPAPKIVTGKPVKLTLYRGYGGEQKVQTRTGESVMTNNAKYFAFTKEYAEQYGENVEEVTLRLEKPYVITDDTGLEKFREDTNGSKLVWTWDDNSKTVLEESERRRQWLLKNGYDSLVISLDRMNETRKTRNMFDESQVIILEKEKLQTASVTADNLIAEGKPVEAERVRNDADTLTIVPDSLEESIEVFMTDVNKDLLAKINAVIKLKDANFIKKNGEAVKVRVVKDGSFEVTFAKGKTEPASFLLQFMSKEEIERQGGEKTVLENTFAPLQKAYKSVSQIAKQKKLLASGEAVDRPEQLVTKTKLKDLLGDKDRIVFTVRFIEEGDVRRQLKNNTFYLYNKTETSETYLRPSALGLVDNNLKEGQEVILDASELKATGTFLKGVDSQRRVMAEAIPKTRFTNYANPVYSMEMIEETLNSTAGLYTKAEKTKLFKKHILPKLKKIKEIKSDEEIIFYEPARGEETGIQFVNLDIDQVWNYAITDKFQVKVVKEAELIGTNFTEKDRAGVRLYYPQSDFVIDKQNRIREKRSMQYAKRPEVAKQAENEFYEVSDKVQKAEPAGGRPSRFLAREPKVESKIGDIALNEEQLQKAEPIELDKLVKRQEIARVLKSQLNAVVRYGKFRSKAYGVYKQNTDTIRLSTKDFSPREGGQLTTLIHEIGHYIDYSIQKFRNVIPKQEIKPLLEEYGAGYDSVPANKRRSEAFAEFLRYYITQPEKAKTKAPEFLKYFENTLDTMPEIKDTLQTARRDFERWKNQPAAAKVAAQINFNGTTGISKVKEVFSSFNDMYRAFIDDIIDIKAFGDLGGKKLKAEDNPYVLARNLRGWVGKANYFMEYGTISGKFWKKGENGRYYIDKTGKSLKDILQPVEKENALTDLSVYLVARRAIELAGRNITSGVTEQDARITLTQLTEKYPNFAKVAEELDQFQTSVLEYLVESGNMSRETFNTVKDLNKMYVPFHRVQEELENKGFLSTDKIPAGNPLKRIKGSEFEIVDPLESIIKNTYTFINFAERNKVMLSMKKLAENNKKAAQKFEKVPVDLTKVASVNAKEIVYQALGASSDMGKMLLPGEVQLAVEMIVPDELVNIFRPAFMQKGNVVTVMENGKPQYFELESDLYKAVQGIDREQAALWVQIAAIPARFLRAGATLAPDFMLRNPIRDAGSGFITSKNGFIPILDSVKGLASVLKKDEYYQAWLIAGGDLSTLVSQDREDVRKNRDLLLKRSAQFKQYIMNPLEALRYISSLSELSTRVGEARRALSKGKSPTEAAFDARNISSDFGRRGANTQSISMMAAFFNATIQGNVIFLERLIEDPIRTSTRGILAYTIPTLLLYLVNRDDPEYEEIPRWQKDLFWLVKAPNGVWLRIPKPFIVGTVFSTLPERFLEFVDKRDPDSLEGLAQLLVTGNIPNPFPTGLTPIIENITNYSFFLDRPIVGQGIENLPPEYQYTETTSEVAKLTGQLLNVSPAKVDNLLYGYFATLGRYTVNSLDKVLEGTGVANSVVEPSPTIAQAFAIKAFIVPKPIGSQSNSVNDFYEKRTEVTGYYNRWKDLVEAGEMSEAKEYLAENPEIKLYKPFNTVANQLSEMRKIKNAVYDSPNLTPDQKRLKITEIDTQITNLAYRANNIELE